MIYIFLVFIIASANYLFYLVPWYHIKGVFRVSDLGLFLIFALIPYVIHKKKRHVKMVNPISVLLLLYLFMVMLHVSIASFHYGQSVFSGMIAARHQFFYLFYFVFLFFFAEDKRRVNFFKILTMIAVAILVLSLINYSGLILFYHDKWAEGHGVRAGIKRAFIPAMNIIGVVFIWHFTKFMHSRRFSWSSGIGCGTMYLGLLFRQTRGRILAATASVLWALFRERKIKVLVLILAMALIMSALSVLVLKGDILGENYRTAYSEISQNEGTWGARMATAAQAFKTFKEYPLIGSGALILRQSGEKFLSSRVRTDAYQGDLGYVHFLKNFGIVGVIWMTVLFTVVGLHLIRARRQDHGGHYIAFCEYQLVHMAISNVTIDYVSRIDGIVILTMTLALLSTNYKNGNV